MPLKLLIVDHDSASREKLQSCVGGIFETQQAATGMAALAFLEQFKPDVLLIDVDISDISGYEICQSFKQHAPACHTLFISSQDSREAYLAAYEAGADDFIKKPFQSDELHQKLIVFKRSIETNQQLQSSIQDATHTALQAISNSAELGTVINFFKKASLANDKTALLDALVQTTAKFNLQVAAQIRHNGQTTTLNSQGRSSPLEEHMLETLAQDSQRIYEMGKRLIINFPRIILQIKAMPTDQADLCGRLRDHIAILVEAAENRFDNILNEEQIRGQQALTLNAIGLIQASIQKLETEYREQAGASVRLFSELQTKFEQKMVFLGLTDSQENQLSNMIEQSTLEATQIYDQGLSLDDEFSHVIATLLYLTQQSPNAAEKTTTLSSDSDDILLF
ncbi:response regulator [Deefgea rivuli]|uniref:response regulator n=1 Tax=Deefgea rivuli TaxID=400948 RepID=UPI000488D664|nr:response regulator [Deefgea rivuli]